MNRELRIKQLIQWDNNIKNYKLNPTNFISPQDPLWRTFGVAQFILMNSLGKEWVKKYIHSRDNSENFLRSRTESIQDRDKHLERVADLGEFVLNFLDIEGFDEKLKTLASGQIESTIAEFECAKILFLHDLHFKFVRTVGEKKRDYDLEFSLNGRIICCETKCKIERTELSAKSILKSLETANAQLPKEVPGMIMISIPETIEKNSEVMALYQESARRFFGQNDRIISILFHSDYFYFKEQLEGRLFMVKEFINTKNKFEMYKPLFDENIYEKNRNDNSSRWIDLRKLIENNS